MLGEVARRHRPGRTRADLEHAQAREQVARRGRSAAAARSQPRAARAPRAPRRRARRFAVRSGAARCGRCAPSRRSSGARSMRRDADSRAARTGAGPRSCTCSTISRASLQGASRIRRSSACANSSRMLRLAKNPPNADSSRGISPSLSFRVVVRVPVVFAQPRRRHAALVHVGDGGLQIRNPRGAAAQPKGDVASWPPRSRAYRRAAAPLRPSSRARRLATWPSIESTVRSWVSW